MIDIKRIPIAILVGLALLVQLLNPTLVYADGEVTPEPTAAPTDIVLADPPTAVPPEATPTPEPMETPEVTLSAPEPTEPPPPNDVAVDDPVLLESVQGISGTTSVVIVDENGQILPLATQYAANALENGDPIWCPAGQAPTPWIYGCTGNFDFRTYTPITTLSQLLSAYGSYINNQYVDGTIWITSGNVNETLPITINGSFYTNWANYGLTLQGGWSGIDWDTSIGSNSVFSAPIWIYNWRGNLTIDNITIDNADALGWYALVAQQAWGVAANTTISDTIVTGNNGTGLNISNFGTVTIRNSTFSGNQKGGADIGWGNIVISNSQFDNNTTYGLHAISWQNVFIDGSTFDGNQSHGADISQASHVIINNSSLSGNAFAGSILSDAGSVLISYSSMDRNGGNGAEIYSVRDVALDNGTFNGNGFSGALITDAVAVLSNYSSLNGNGEHGADISSVGDVTFTASTFQDNAGSGSVIDHANSIFMNGSFSEGNGGHGTEISSTGNVIFDGSIFDGNTLSGSLIDGAETVLIRDSLSDGNGANGTEISSAGDVTFDGSTFIGNVGNGSSISGAQTVLISNSFSQQNGANGTEISFAGDVTFDGSTFIGNVGNGSSISDAGSVLVSYSSSDGNEGHGTQISNAAEVIFDGSSFSGNLGTGSLIDSVNSVLILGSSADENGANGVEISNAGDVILDTSSFFGNSGNGSLISDTSLVMMFDSFFEANGGHGAEIHDSDGLVVENGYFGGNTGTGLTLANLYTIDIYGSTFSENLGDSLSISDMGTVSAPIQYGNIFIYDIYADNVNINNVHLQNGSVLVSAYNNADILIDNVTVDGASGFGLGLETWGGNVVIQNSSATNTTIDENNDFFPWGDGADIFTGGGNITIRDSHFDGNAFDGLYVVADGGNVSVENSTFNRNQVGGLDVLFANSVDIKATEFTGNNPLFYDLFADCSDSFLSLIFEDLVATVVPPSPVLVDIFVDSMCAPSNYLLSIKNPDPNLPPITIPNSAIPEPVQGIDKESLQHRRQILEQGTGPSRAPESHQELFVCYAGQESHTIPLPNGDKVEIVCPVGGKAFISRLDNITLPQELPEGYTFASAYAVEIWQLVPGRGANTREPIDVITEGGHIKVSFVAPPIGSEDNYSILFWDEDNGIWIPLNDYVRDANGLPRRFNLHAENPEDQMRVLSGVEFVSKVNPPRVEVSTNFPGIFVLALR